MPSSILCVGSVSFPIYDLTGIGKSFEVQNGNSSPQLIVARGAVNWSLASQETLTVMIAA
jgi:hypothetical protein